MTELTVLLIATAVTAFVCRAGGFWFMRFVPLTPRVERALRATPLAVMVGIAAPAVVRGGLAESVGLAAAVVTMRITGNDLVAAAVGVAAVAVVR